MKRLLSGLVPTTFIAMALTACGGGPDIDKVKADFESPSGSAKDKNAVIAANGKQSEAGNNSALSLAGGGVPGLGLTAEGRGSGFARIAPLNVFGRNLVNVAATGLHRSELRVAQSTPSCFQSSDFEAANAKLSEAIATGKSASAHISISANLSDCDGSLTGSLKMSMDMKVEKTKISYAIETTFTNVCDGDNCVDGGMNQEALIDLSAADMTNLFGSIKVVSAWDLTATNGADVIKSKGGLRIGYSSDANGEAAKVEFLEYVTDSSGAEVSYVLIIEANSMNGTASITIRCNDGELTCSFNESSGEGMCSGTVDGTMFDVSWTGEDYTTVTKSEDFKGG